MPPDPERSINSCTYKFESVQKEPRFPIIAATGRENWTPLFANPRVHFCCPLFRHKKSGHVHFFENLLNTRVPWTRSLSTFSKRKKWKSAKREKSEKVSRAKMRLHFFTLFSSFLTLQLWAHSIFTISASKKQAKMMEKVEKVSKSMKSSKSVEKVKKVNKVNKVKKVCRGGGKWKESQP